MPGLSCFTANLHAYLAAECNADARLGDSVRLAVRDADTDTDAGRLDVSHHSPSLDVLGDGTRLRYTGAATPTALLPQLAAEIDRYGRVLVVVDHARLPWSATFGGPAAPHWLLLQGHRQVTWQAVDTFRATLPDGRQQATFAGPIDTAALTAALAVSANWTRAHRSRLALAFGAPAPVPVAGALALRREPDTGTRQPGDGWLVGAAALPSLTARLSDHLDDLWAAAGHHCFALLRRHAEARNDDTRRHCAAALDDWAALPHLLRIAAESAARGRPRDRLVRAALDRLTVLDGPS